MQTISVPKPYPPGAGSMSGHLLLTILYLTYPNTQMFFKADSISANESGPARACIGSLYSRYLLGIILNKLWLFPLPDGHLPPY